jgi:hypothetical protein
MATQSNQRTHDYADAILAYVEGHPGTSRAEILNAAGLTDKPASFADKCIALARAKAHEAGKAIPYVPGGRGGYLVTDDLTQTVTGTGWLAAVTLGVQNALSGEVAHIRATAHTVGDAALAADLVAFADAAEAALVGAMAAIEDATADLMHGYHKSMLRAARASA